MKTKIGIFDFSPEAKMYIKGMIDWKEYRGRVEFNKMKKEENEKREKARIKSHTELIDAFYEKRKKESEE